MYFRLLSLCLWFFLLENWPSTYFNQHHQVKTRIQAHNHPESTRSIQIRTKNNNTTNVCVRVCFGYLPIPFHSICEWTRVCVCSCLFSLFSLSLSLSRHRRISVLFYKNPNDFGFSFPQIGFRIALLVFGFIYIKYVRTRTHSQAHAWQTKR